MQDKSPVEALSILNVRPDFVCNDASARLNYIHRVVKGAEVYFVANPKTAANEVSCSFRVSGKRPELWHPDTGVVEPAPVYSERDGRTTVTLPFGPAGSVFVVFRKPSSDHAVSIQRTEVARETK